MNDQSSFLTFLILAGALVANLWTFFYAWRPWWRTYQGQALMVKSVGNCLLLNMAVAFTLFGEYPYREQVRTFSFGVFFLGLCFLLGSLLFSKGSKQYPPWSWLPKNRERG